MLVAADPKAVRESYAGMLRRQEAERRFFVDNFGAELLAGEDAEGKNGTKYCRRDRAPSQDVY